MNRRAGHGLARPVSPKAAAPVARYRGYDALRKSCRLNLATKALASSREINYG